jgi:addiction module RelE/StbE family toxin
MKLRFTPRAVVDITAIADYIRERNPEAARRVRAELLGSLQNLLIFPLIGRQQAVKEVRKLVLRQYPYLIYYSYDAAHQEIVILSIKHQAEDREHHDA